MKAYSMLKVKTEQSVLCSPCKLACHSTGCEPVHSRRERKKYIKILNIGTDRSVQPSTLFDIHSAHFGCITVLFPVFQFLRFSRLHDSGLAGKSVQQYYRQAVHLVASQMINASTNIITRNIINKQHFFFRVFLL